MPISISINLIVITSYKRSRSQIVLYLSTVAYMLYSQVILLKPITLLINRPYLYLVKKSFQVKSLIKSLCSFIRAVLNIKLLGLLPLCYII